MDLFSCFAKQSRLIESLPVFQSRNDFTSSAVDAILPSSPLPPSFLPSLLFFLFAPPFQSRRMGPVIAFSGLSFLLSHTRKDGEEGKERRDRKCVEWQNSTHFVRGRRISLSLSGRSLLNGRRRKGKGRVGPGWPRGLQ